MRKLPPAKRVALVSALLVGALAPLCYVVKASGGWADRYGTAVGRLLGEAASRLPARTASPVEEVFFADAAPLTAGPATPSKGSGSHSGKGAKGAKAPKKRGVFVPAATVLRLAEGRVMPRAAPVAADSRRPAGLRLIGVGGLGVGMRDGDVLTRVLGGGVGSVGDVVARVIAARDRRAREISAEFWRDGEAWSLVVEQPYLNPVVQP